MNLLTVIGRVGRDAELQTTSGGTSIAKFSVAMESGYGDSKKTTWLACRLFGQRAEKVVDHIRKGQQIGLAGELSLEEWKDRDGNSKHALAVKVEKLTFVGGAPQGGSRETDGQRPRQDTRRQDPPPRQQSPKGDQDEWEDDIPF